MKYHLIVLLSSSLIFFASCGGEDVISEPAGAAQYFINNQTTGELNVSFVTTTALGSMTIDTIPTFQIGVSKEIFQDGIIGVNPRPEDSFSELLFIKDNDFDQPYKITEVSNDQWEIISTDFNGSSYGLTIFQLNIRDEDFN